MYDLSYNNKEQNQTNKYDQGYKNMNSILVVVLHELFSLTLRQKIKKDLCVDELLLR